MTDPMNEEGRAPDEQPDARMPLWLKVFGVLSILGGLTSLGDLVPVIVSFVQGFATGGYRTASIVIFAALMAVLVVSAVLFVFLGVRLLRAGPLSYDVAAQAQSRSPCWPSSARSCCSACRRTISPTSCKSSSSSR